MDCVMQDGLHQCLGNLDYFSGDDGETDLNGNGVMGVFSLPLLTHGNEVDRSPAEFPTLKMEPGVDFNRGNVYEFEISGVSPTTPSRRPWEVGEEMAAFMPGILCSGAAAKTSRKRKTDDIDIFMVVDEQSHAKKTKENEEEISVKTKKKEHLAANNEDKVNKIQKQEYIHVRARRGQATDSHSLAERIRREKISEKMKYLQDLVPGCNKIIGKAGLLDEIINYVQSLQRQIECLSMKLAIINSEPDLDHLLAKQGCVSDVSTIGKLPEMVNPIFLQFNSVEGVPFQDTHCL